MSAFTRFLFYVVFFLNFVICILSENKILIYRQNFFFISSQQDEITFMTLINPFKSFILAIGICINVFAETNRNKNVVLKNL
jgi:hypothetical protein